MQRNARSDGSAHASEDISRLVTCPSDKYVVGDVIAKGGFGR